MAVELGSKVVKDTKLYNDYAIGISLPLQIGQTAFNQTFTSIDAVKTNIKSLLLTKKQERVMQPELGCGLHEVLFEPIDDFLSEKIETTIIDSLSKWLPFVNVESIEIDANDELRDNNKVDIYLTFTVTGNPQLQTVTFTVQE
jgi:uncharacterized protein